MLKIKYLCLVLFFAVPVYARESHKLGPAEYGAHLQAGFYPNNHGARGTAGNGDLGFMTNPDFNLNQAWIWFARAAQTETNDFDYGFRLDAFYGTDAFFAAAVNSAYETPGGGIKKYWDAGFMRRRNISPGVYGIALPQSYAEISYYKWKLAAGRIFSIVGYEQVDAAQNDFYSKAFYTMTIPSSGTGALVKKSYGRADLTAGYFYGMDAGFYNPFKDYFFTGGAAYNFNEDAYIFYSFLGGRYGNNINGGTRLFVPAGAFVYLHNLTFEFKPAANLKFTAEAFYNHDNKPSFSGNAASNLYGVNEYAVYDINEKLAAGLRAEFARFYEDNQNRFAATANITYKPVKWFYVRPEARYSWGDAQVYNGGKDKSQFNLGAEFTALF